MRVADKVAEWLEEKGITHAFGIIGGGNVALFDAIQKRGATQIICTHHEQAAAMAATYYWRTCGRIAPVLVTTGAGSSNAITGVLAAWMDAIPLLCISGNEASQSIQAGTRIKGVQGYHSAQAGSAFCKRGFIADNVPDALPRLYLAHQIATTPRYGPVWYDLPKDIANAPYLG